MKKIFVLIFLILIFNSDSAIAKSLQVGLAASADVVSGNVELTTQKDFGLVCFNAGISHHDEDYSIGNALIALKTSRLMPGFRFGLGFKAVLGKVDEEHGHFDGNLAAISFWLGLDYELKATVNPINIPVELFTDLSFAPDSISFEDSTQYLELKGGLKLWVLENACIYLACQYTDIEFENKDHGSWDRDDTIFLGGITLRF